MKRKVAGGMSGNFRGVCPISNRANQDNDTVCVHTSSAWRQLCRFVLYCCLCWLGNIFGFRVFL